MGKLAFLKKCKMYLVLDVAAMAFENVPGTTGRAGGENTKNPVAIQHNFSDAIKKEKKGISRRRCVCASDDTECI